MMDIKEIKTRDISIINMSLDACMEPSRNYYANRIDDLDGMLRHVESYPFDVHIVWIKEEKAWLVTNVYDDDIYPQDYFRDQSFVIYETDLALALGRAIHYTYHKKIKD